MSGKNAGNFRNERRFMSRPGVFIGSLKKVAKYYACVPPKPDERDFPTVGAVYDRPRDSSCQIAGGHRRPLQLKRGLIGGVCGGAVPQRIDTEKQHRRTTGAEL